MAKARSGASISQGATRTALAQMQHARYGPATCAGGHHVQGCSWPCASSHATDCQGRRTHRALRPQYMAVHHQACGQPGWRDPRDAAICIGRTRGPGNQKAVNAAGCPAAWPPAWHGLQAYQRAWDLAALCHLPGQWGAHGPLACASGLPVLPRRIPQAHVPGHQRHDADRGQQPPSPFASRRIGSGVPNRWVGRLVRSCHLRMGPSQPIHQGLQIKLHGWRRTRCANRRRIFVGANVKLHLHVPARPPCRGPGCRSRAGAEADAGGGAMWLGRVRGKSIRRALPQSPRSPTRLAAVHAPSSRPRHRAVLTTPGRPDNPPRSSMDGVLMVSPKMPSMSLPWP